MASKQIIDKIANDGVRLGAELCNDATDQGSAARMPLQVYGSVNISGAMYFCPTMRTARLFMPDLDEAEFFLQLRIAHDLVPQ